MLIVLDSVGILGREKRLVNLVKKDPGRASNSRKKFYQTMYQPLFSPLYSMVKIRNKESARD